VAGLCATLVEQQISGVPQPEGVSLTREGQVAVVNRARLLSASALPRLLHGLLPNGTTPPPLRLFALHAMAPDNTSSIGEVGASLEYYERPGRHELVQAVFQRVLDTPADQVPERSHSFDLDDPPPTQPPTESHTHRRGRWWVAAAALLVCTAGAVVYGIAATPRLSATAGENEATDVRTIADDIEDVARTVTDAVRDKVAALVATAPATTTPAPAPAPVALRPTRSAGAARTRRVTAPPPTPAEPDLRAPAGAHPEATEPASIAAPPELLASPFAAADGRVIYSSVTFDVVPPVLRDPHRLPGALQVADESATNAIEILISEAGAVERVTMVRPSTHLTDMMLLGAAKTWKFDPATRHGLAVKYRLRLDWAEAQR
jgi:hypothetical protein